MAVIRGVLRSRTPYTPITRDHIAAQIMCEAKNPKVKINNKHTK